MEKVGIIGGGPLGLYVASLCEKNNINYVLFEATNTLGGQINLYPNKRFLDVDGFYNQESITFIDSLKSQISLTKVKLSEKVLDVKSNENYAEIITNKKTYQFEYAVIAIGLGAYTPRTMELENESKCENILYSLTNLSMMKDKKVAIFGGGDSALDWAKEICCISNNVSLIHRRTEFRGNADTIKDCCNLKIYLPYVPYKILLKDNKCETITIKKVDNDEIIDIPVDYVLVNYGSIPKTIPLSNLPHQGNFLLGDENHKLINRVYGVGDCIIYNGKIRRIEPGKIEANKVIDLIK